MIEITVVMLIVAIMLGVVTLSLTRDRTDVLRDEAYRLVITLQSAQQQSILEGRPYAFGLTDDGYEFFRPNDKGRLTPIHDDESLGPRKFSNHISLDPLHKTDESEKRRSVIVFEPSGEFTPFTLVLRLENAVWYVEGGADGEIRSSGTPSES